jgi:hypothetical protein
MNGRKIFRKYAQSLGKEANSFVEIKSQFYGQDSLITKDSKGRLETTTISYKDMVHWIIKQKKEDL